MVRRLITAIWLTTAAPTILAVAASTAALGSRPQDDALDDIVVTARKGAPLPSLDALGQFERLCFDPIRKTGGPAPPMSDADWAPLDPNARTRFGLAGSDAPAFGLRDEARGQTLLVKFERLPHRVAAAEVRCTMVIVGDYPRRALIDRISGLLRGPGTTRHVGHVDGVPALADWEQWLWTAMPARGSQAWRSINSGRRGPPSWLVVSDRTFYDAHDYVYVDVKLRKDRRVVLLSLGYVTQGRSTR